MSRTRAAAGLIGLAAMSAGSAPAADRGAWCDVVEGEPLPSPPTGHSSARRRPDARIGIGAQEIDVLFLASRKAVEERGIAFLRRHAGRSIAWADDVHDRSETSVVLRAVGFEIVEWDDETDTRAAFDDLRGVGPDPIPGVDALRAAYGADLVHLLSASTTGAAGIADLPGWRSVVSLNRDNFTPGSTFTHETGHNFGCRHERSIAGTNQGFAFGYCFVGSDNVQYSTIMAFCLNGGDGTVAPVFSSPTIRWKGAVTGAPAGSSHSADNARHVKEQAPSVAALAETAERAPDPFVDEYATSEDTPIHVTDPGEGVLGNDLPFPTLTCELEYPPSNGTLDLHPDGTFRYVPGTEFSGQDLFFYRASDGTDRSEAMGVVIDVGFVDDPLTFSPTPSAKPSWSLPGEKVVFSAGAVDPDDPPYRIEWTFDDIAWAQGEVVEHEYRTPGVYDATVRAASRVSGAKDVVAPVRVRVGSRLDIDDLRWKFDPTRRRRGSLRIAGIARTPAAPPSNDFEVRIGERSFPVTLSNGSAARTRQVAALVRRRNDGIHFKVRISRDDVRDAAVAVLGPVVGNVSARTFVRSADETAGVVLPLEVSSQARGIRTARLRR